MIAPVIQKPITLFFSPITTLTGTNNTTTTTILTTTPNRLALKPVSIGSRNTQGSSMNQGRQLSPNNNLKSKQTGNDTRGHFNKVNGIEPPAKKQKIEAGVNGRVGIPLRNGTIGSSRAEGHNRPAVGNSHNHAVQQPTTSKHVDINGDAGKEDVSATQKLKIKTNDSFGAVGARSIKADNVASRSRDRKEDSKRSLRSKDGGSRSKSELAQYFPNFDDIVNPDAKEKEFLTPRTRLYITEEPQKISGEPQFVLPTPVRTRAPSLTIAAPLPAPSMKGYKFEQIELPRVHVSGKDPLADCYYEVAHRRAERQEKQLRNIERERAQHEKVQLERLYEGLLGPDWLKVMGISGVTEGDRKKWDDARDYFIKEVKSLLDKFARWKDEERRRKLVEIQKRKEAEEEDSEEAEESPTPEPSPDAAAQQLQSETLASIGGKSKSTRARKPSKRALEAASPPPSSKKPKPKARPVSQLIPQSLPPPSPIFNGPFTSFFAKPHQRAAAMDKNRRTGRTKWAFGHPIPDLPMEEFSLPDDMISPEARKASARARRGVRRARD